MAGKLILHYTVIQEFDLGPFGRVIKSMDTKTNKLVALKFPPRDFLADFVMRKTEWKKFVDDMNIAQSIQHPSLCNVTENNELNGEFFYVTDYIEGVTIKDVIETQLPQPKIALAIAEKVLQVFDIYHPKDITIGVLRADHISLTTDGKVKLLDLPSIRLKDFASLHDDEDHLLSLSYQAPEILKKEPTDDRSDLYSLGVIIFQMLTGQLPFVGKTMDELIYAIMYKDAPQVSSIVSTIPSEIALVVKRMLSKNPAWRYKHASDLISEIARLKQTLGNPDEMKEKFISDTIGNLVPIVQKRIEQRPPKIHSYRKEPVQTVVLKPEPARPEPPRYEPPKPEPPRYEPKPTPKYTPPEIKETPKAPKVDMFTDDLLRVAEEEARKAASFGTKPDYPAEERPAFPTSHQPFQAPADKYQPPVSHTTSPIEHPHLPTVEEFIVPPIAEGETEERKLSSIVFTDIRGFSKKMGENETIAMRVLQMHNSIMESLFTKYGGKVIKSIGDAYMVDFSSAVNGVRCAVEAQERLWEYNRSQMTELERVFVRIGIHMGDVVIKGNDIFGDAVNIAARIESISEAGRITITGDVYQQVRNKMSLDVLYLGKRQLKNIQEAVEVYQIMLNTIPETLPTTEELQRARDMEREEQRRQEEEFRRREEEARLQNEVQQRRKREQEEQRKAEEDLRRRRSEEERRRKEDEERLRKQEEERKAALRRAVAACLQAVNRQITGEQFEQAAKELAHANSIDPGNEDIKLMENRLRIAQEEARMRREEMQRRLEEERLRREAEDARRKADEETQRVAVEEERRRREEQERREIQLKKIAEYLEKGELYLRDADFERARNELSRIYILDPGNAAARVFEGKIKDFELQVVREREERESKQRTVEEEKRRKRERENQIQMFIVRAQDLYQKHRYDEAIDEIVRIYAIDPENSQAHKWEEKIRVAQESQQKTAAMLGSAMPERESRTEAEPEESGGEIYEKPSVELSAPAGAEPIRKWYPIAFGTVALLILLILIAGPVSRMLFPKNYVVVVLPFTSNRPGDGTGNGLAVLAAADLDGLKNVSVIDPISAASGNGKTYQMVLADLRATYLLTGTMNISGDRADITLTVQDSTQVLSTATLSGSIGNIAQLRSEIRSTVAGMLNVTESEPNSRLNTFSTNTDAVGYLFAGIARFEEGRYDRAIVAFDSAAITDSAFADAYCWLSRALLDSCEVLGTAKNEIGSHALAAARKSIVLNPQLADGFAALATYDRLIGSFTDARSSALHALSLSNDNPRANAELAIASLVFDDMKTADECAARAIKFDPHSYRSWMASAITKHFQRRYKDASHDYQLALQNDRSHTYETTIFLMADAMHRGDLNDLSISTYFEMLAKEPDDYFIAYRLGRIYQGIGKKSEGDQYLNQAVANAENAISKNSDDAQAHLVHGLAVMRLGRFNEGFAEVQRVANMNQENPTFLYGLARAYAINHKDKEAFDALSKAVEKEYRISAILDLDLYNLEGNERYADAITLQDIQH